jgi:hypothetical protein
MSTSGVQGTGCISWFNQKHLDLGGNLTGDGTNVFSTANTWVEVNSAFRVFFLSWGDSAVVSRGNIGFGQSTVNDNMFAQMFLDSVGATFTGSTSGTTLNVTSISSGTISAGQNLSGSGVSANTYVTGVVTPGSTYTINNSLTLGSRTFTTSGDPAHGSNAGIEKSNQPGGLLGRTFWQGLPTEGQHNFSLYLIANDTTGFVTHGGNDHHVNLFG